MKRWFRSTSPAEVVTSSVTRHRRDAVKRRAPLALAAVLVALPLGALGTQAGALTPWKTFGTGKARGLGQSVFLDDSMVLVNSVTLENPARMRIVVRGPSAGRADIEWSMFCGNSVDEFARTRTFSYKARLPHVVDLSNRLGGVSRWRHCFLESQVRYHRFGAVTLLFQARY